MIDLDIDFRAILAPTWSHLGPQVGAILASKIAPEPSRTPSETRSGARIRPDRLLCDLGPNLGPSWASSWGSWPQLRGPSWASSWGSWPQLGAILGLKLGLSWPPKSPWSRPRRLPRRARFWLQLGGILGPKLGPSWSPKSTRSRPRRLPRRARKPQSAQTWVQNGNLFG